VTAEQVQALWRAPDRERIRGKRDQALLALLLACGLRRHELAGLMVSHLQQREGHWAIVDLCGKAGHVRTIPVPDWVYALLDDWTRAARINAGSLFRRVSSAGRVWGDVVTEKLAMSSKSSPRRLALANSRRTIFVEVALVSAAPLVASWSRFNFFSALFPCRRPSDTSVALSGFRRL